MDFKTPEDFHQKLSLLFHGLIALPLAVFVYLFLEIKHNNLPGIIDGSLAKAVNFTFNILAVALTVFAYYRFKKSLQRIRVDRPMKKKLEIYFSYAVSFFVLVTISSVLFVAGLYLTTSAVFIVGYVVLLFLLSLSRPTHQKYVRNLPLKEEERNAIIYKQPFPDAN